MPAKDKIAIIGKAPSSRGLGPWDDPTWQVWTLSDLNQLQQIPRWDVHFELHPLHWLADNPGYLEWLRKPHEKPIYTREDYRESIPASKPFPIRELLEAFGGCRYWTNTVSYLIGFAIMHKPTSIGVWGVDMAQSQPVFGGSPEYQNQRPSCEWLLGFAMGAGIEVVIPDESDLLKTPYLYGFEHAGTPMRRKWEARSEELHRRVQNQQQKAEQFQQQANQCMINVHHLQGALDAQQYYEQWTHPDLEWQSQSSSSPEAPKPPSA